MSKLKVRLKTEIIFFYIEYFYWNLKKKNKQQVTEDELK